ncbi:MAG: response regulator [Bacteroidota bacterium]|nr:response regulator [Bacteroidota bacterium]
MDEKPNILFVDDEPMILSSLNMLFKSKYKVYLAENGFDALEIIKSVAIKVIVSDQRMPGMLGHELLRQVKEISPNTVRMLLTGYSDLDAIIGSVNAGEVFRFINKPWQSEFMLYVMKLGVEIYDKVTHLREEEMLKQEEPGTVEHPVSDRRVHIEVEEESPTVMFVDYSGDETTHLVEKFQSSYNVVGVNSIDAAFQEMAKKPVSVIVSNINFGDVDGVSFLDTIRREYPNTVSVILTEVRDASLAIRSINELNVFRYLVKPMPEDQISHTLEKAIERSKTYKKTPYKNVLKTAEEIAPERFSKNEESTLRLRLRAAQALLSKNRTKKQ